MKLLSKLVVLLALLCGATALGPNGTITHVVVILQENRTVDNLFQGYCTPGSASYNSGANSLTWSCSNPNWTANTVNFGYNSRGQQIALVPIDMCGVNTGCNCYQYLGHTQSCPNFQNYDLKHTWGNFNTEWNNGGMNGWDKAHYTGSCTTGNPDCPPDSQKAYGYVPTIQVYPYFEMSNAYAMGDNMFETPRGPSFVAHQYFVSGTATCGTLCIPAGSVPSPWPTGPGANHATPPPTQSQYANFAAANNPDNASGGGCDAPVAGAVDMLSTTAFALYPDLLYTCFDRPTIFDELTAAGDTWHWYQDTGGAALWHGPDAVWHLWNSTSYTTNVTWPPSNILTDISGGHLANFVVVTPTVAASDHSNSTDGSGPAWVMSVINAIGGSSYWNNTVVIVTWDDWGGWFDHVAPPTYATNEWSFRVPIMVISPYTLNGYISHTQHNFGSIFRFTEEAFNIAPLGTDDGLYSDDLSDFFNWLSGPHSFAGPFAGELPERYWAMQKTGPQYPVDY